MFFKKRFIKALRYSYRAEARVVVFLFNGASHFNGQNVPSLRDLVVLKHLSSVLY